MTRRSKRELERAADRLADAVGGDGGLTSMVAYRTEDGYVDADGEELPTDEHGDLDVEPPATGSLIVLDGEYTTIPGEGGVEA